MDWRTWRLQFGALVAFGLAAVALVALGSWWFLYLTAAVAREDALRVQLASCRGAPDPEVLRQIAAATERRYAMIYGEGGLLMLLLVAVLAMLWRLVRAERRFRLEMRDFLGRVTHEMKTPLAGIKAVLQTVASGRMPADELVAMSTMALREVEREEHLVQNLLLAQRMRLPEQQLAADLLDVSATLGKFVQAREGLHTPLRFALQCADDLRAVGDAAALWTILENLTDNAAKYGASHVAIRADVHDQRLRIQLTDDGQGWGAAAQAGLFEPFVRAVDAGLGTGLGLHLSRQLARRMGGELTGRSPGVGQGATFTVELPRPTTAA